jgi:hypothetical protein
MELTEVAVDVAQGEDEELDAGDIGVPGEPAAWAGEVEGVESGALVTALVRFRLLGWYSVAGDTLTAELREAVNRRGHGVSWLASCHVAPVTAPSEGTSHTLVLMQPLCGGHAEEALHRWADVQRAAEGVMMSHLGEIVCGGCDCLETLAGKVLT